MHRLLNDKVQVWSYQEPWLEVGGEMVDLLLALTGWVARYESNRRSERCYFVRGALAMAQVTAAR